MEYLTGRYQCNSMDANAYMSAYAGCYGFNDLQAGGISNLLQIQNFTASYFDTFTVSMTDMSAYLTGSNTILAGVKNSDGTDHAVVIEGYNTTNNTYIYFDPAIDQRKEKSASEFSFALGVSGAPSKP